MDRCPSCSTEVPADGRFCPGCGGAVGSESAFPTQKSPTIPTDATPTSSSSSWGSSSSVDAGRFPPGTMLAERYRIASKLGKGGMGEVYRADDLKLGQPVALKFLPPGLGANEAMLARFHHEVRIARQVSHANVTRVYDIGEVNGEHFLSMEYVDGEDLRSLVKRIGRLPPDKAVQISRQLCAGLAAAHDMGVLHRDLKPANVMLDGEGRVRITDFGLAGIVGEIHGAEVRSGTPTYMAPEQLAGREVSIASDIYALGLVLFELFTGKPPFRASSIDELMRMQQEEPTSPSSLVRDLDPAVERVILRCLSRAPAERPSSALAVAAALPGGDPLAAALAAGETPSPEMVASSGLVGLLRPAVAWSLLAAVVIALAAAVPLSWSGSMFSRVNLEKPPAALVADAREVLEDLGYDDDPLDSSWSFEVNTAFQDYLEDGPEEGDDDGLASTVPDWDSFQEGARAGLLFWYRQSPRYLRPYDPRWPRMSRTDPPPLLPGMLSVQLTPEGQLLQLRAVPPATGESRGEPVEPDWTSLLSTAGLDASSLTPAAPEWTPPMFADARAAWTGSFDDGEAMRVEAASYRGRPVYFRLLGPWNKPVDATAEETPLGQRVFQMVGFTLLMLALLAAALLAWRHVRQGRGDRRGAFRIALFHLTAHTIVWAMIAKHVPVLAQMQASFFSTLGINLFQAMLVYVLYLALEPYVRRRSPDSIIAWTRLLAGRFRDPLVGRDILIGIAVGAAFFLFVRSQPLVSGLLGLPTDAPPAGGLGQLLGANHVLGQTLDKLVHAMQPGMIVLVILMVLTALLRNEWVARGVFLAIIVSGAAMFGPSWLAAVYGAVFAIVLVTVVIRLGLLAATSMFYVMNLLGNSPLTVDFSQWYAPAGLVSLLVPLALAGFGFYVAMAGRPLFSEGLLQE